jgi:endonuclease/exonuclease/phosphatase family metal-dependent hydrolase
MDGGSPATDGGTDAGTSVPFSAANWNIEWFGETTQGPSDEALQLSNAQYVISSAGMDFWALQEVVSPAAFDALKQQLPGYDGFLASDASRVSAGSSYYTVDEQKLAVLFRSDVVSVRRAEVILTAYNYDFASRPPLRVDLSVTRNGTRVDLVAILLHLKAFSASADYSRRLSAAAALKSYLDTYLPNTPVLVLGDWNDDVDVSISYDSTAGAYRDTPFQNFLDASPTYSFLTRPLSLAGVRSTVSGSQFIDHQLATRPLAPALLGDSPQVLRPAVPSYGTTTSDHYPVLSRFELGRVGGLQAPFPEAASEPAPPGP